MGLNKIELGGSIKASKKRREKEREIELSSLSGSYKTKSFLVSYKPFIGRKCWKQQDIDMGNECSNYLEMHSQNAA